MADGLIYKIVDMSYGEIHHAEAVQIPVLINRLKLDGTQIYIKTSQQRIDDYMELHSVPYDQIFPPAFTQDFADCEAVKEVLDSPEWSTPIDDY